MICDFGDVAVVPFPFTDLPVTKYRPALVLSRLAFNETNGSTMLAMITSAKESTWPSDLLIADGAEAGLHRESMVRWKIFTLTNELVERTVGKLGRTDRAAVRHALRSVLG